MQSDNLLFRQMFESESCTFTYLLADMKTKEGIIIDTVAEKHERDLKIIEELGIKLKYVIDTHVHADHVTGAGLLRDKTGAKSVIGKNASVGCIDMGINDGEELHFGAFTIKAIATPGHTNGCTCYLVDNMVFTGDTLLIRGCGRTDFQEGSPESLHKSINEKLFTLPGNTIVYPGHNYIGLQWSSIDEEKTHNPRLGGGKSLNEFKEIMDNLKLDYPKKIDVAVPANKKCGEVHQA